MTDPYDPYRQNQPPGQPPQPPYGGGQYGQPYGQPYPGGQPYEDPYQGGGYHGDPYQGGGYQGGQPYQPYQDRPDATRQFEQPYGQQPYQGSYGQPAGWGAPGGPGGPGGFPPPRKKSRTPVILAAVIAVLVLVAGGVAAAIALNGGDDPSAAPSTTTSAADDPTTTTRRTTTRPPTTTAGSDDFEAGQCATLTPEDNNRATIRITECGGLLSDVVIAKVQDTECAEPFLSFDPGEGKVYCLAMDAKEGDCFRLDNLIKRALACVGDETRKVVKIFDGVADDQQCAAVPETVDVYAYPDPPRTLCLGKADL